MFDKLCSLPFGRKIIRSFDDKIRYYIYKTHCFVHLHDNSIFFHI